MDEKHEEFLKALRNLLNSSPDIETIERVQICYNRAEYIYLSREKPKDQIMSPNGYMYDTHKRQDPETGWWIWSF